MRLPLSWLKEYVDLTISAEELAERLTLAGLEVKAIEYVGVPQGEAPSGIIVPPSDHLVWDRERIVLGAIREVKSHPNADRLVLAMVDDGGPELEQVVTGAPNLFPYKDQGPLDPPLWSPYAKAGAEIYDGHGDGKQRLIIQERTLRGIPNRSMVCSAKELGLGTDHEGIILLEAMGFPPGTPLADVLGDVIFDLDLTPNMARAYGILGVAREVAALTGAPLREPSYAYVAEGGPVEEAFAIEIRNPELNPRFCGMLITNVEIRPSPQWAQRRLEAAGIRAINNIVDVTNYVMFETGQPLHAFDYDILLRRSGGKPPTLITRTAEPGEKLMTLDGIERALDDQSILVCDTEGVLSLGGIMGGDESEIRPTTRNVLLEAANWNFINIRRTMTVQKMSSEAGTRFSRGVHPAQARRAIQRAAELMRQWGSGTIAQGVIDVYPRPAPVIRIELPIREVERLIGVPIGIDEVADILQRLQFEVSVSGEVLHVTVPDHRVDIGSGDIGIADLAEEIARIYGYDRLPNTLIEDLLPPQYNNEELAREELVRDILVRAGLREVINYRLTTPEAEARLTPLAQPSSWPQADYVRLANPISADKSVLRHTLLNGLLENIAHNERHAERQKVFEIGSVFLASAESPLPEEPRHLAIALTGARTLPAWQDGAAARKHLTPMDFYDLKGVLEALVRELRLPAGTVAFKPEEHHTFHPGRCAGLYVRGQWVGVAGEVHPLVREAYDIKGPVVAAELLLDPLIAELPLTSQIVPIPTQPAVYQDIALVVSEATPASEVEATIRAAGGALLRDVSLFDVYRGEPIPPGKKSLAYALSYQAEDRTLTDSEVAKVHQRIVWAAEQKLGATLRA